MYRIGFDIGGTKIECCVLSPDNKILFRARRPTKTVYNEVRELLMQALQETGVKEYTVGIGAPGSISKATGLLKNSNIEFLNGTDFLGTLEHQLQLPVKLANDSQCFALAESCLGAAAEFDVVLGIILGTGVGGGLVINKKLHAGHHGIASEWGHVDLDPSNQIHCRCGRTGCVETWLSGTGIQQWGNQLLGKNLTAAECLQNDSVQSVFLSHLGQALANIIQIVDPDCIVVGGGVSNSDIIYSHGPEYISKFLFNDILSIPVLSAKLGDSAGSIGAALL